MNERLSHYEKKETSPAANGRNAKYLRLRQRVKVFALSIIQLYGILPRTVEAQVISRQLLRSGTSVGAHFVEGHRAKSKADFISKMEGGMQELEESLYWLELLSDLNTIDQRRLQSLMNEADELMKIFVTIVRTVKSR